MKFDEDEDYYDEEGELMPRKSAKMERDDDTLLMKSSGGFVKELERYLSVGSVKRMFSLGSELFGAVTPFLDNPTWWTAGASIFSMGKVLVDDVEVWSEDYFSGDDWIQPYNANFNQTLVQVLQKYPFERFKTTTENNYIRICTLPNGVKFGWTYFGSTQQVDHVYVDSRRVEEAKTFIKKILWEQYEGKSLVMRKNTKVVFTGDDARILFEIDDAFESMLSKTATDYSAYLKKPLDAGVSRSVMFYGPPGTGKSTLARTIVELMGLRSFRIRIGDLGGLDNSTLFEAINIFEPDAVILDDFDRAQGQEQLLETLEFFQQKVKLVITTVNNRSELDDALMRPGRIDELILIDKMDDEVVKHVLGEHVDAFDVVKNWPIAFIVEFVKRRQFMSKEEAVKSVKELASRVNEMSHYCDESTEVERMMKLLKRAKKEGLDLDDDEPDDVDEEIEVTPKKADKFPLD